ncbi:MAG: FCD domain-containing protein, partial [Bacteroidota bacterium]
KLEDTDFAALVETRVVLEQNSARLAAMRRTESDLKNIEAALNAYEAKIEEGGQAVEEDLMFHLAIAEASQNSVLKSLMLVITPDIIHSFNKLEICKSTSIYKALEEHRLILKHIADQQPEEAASAMLAHLQDVSDYSESLRK